MFFLNIKIVDAWDLGIVGQNNSQSNQFDWFVMQTLVRKDTSFTSNSSGSMDLPLSTVKCFRL